MTRRQLRRTAPLTADERTATERKLTDTIRAAKPPPPRPSRSTAAFEQVVFRGRLMDRKTQAFLEAMETKLGYELTVLQGCYNPGGVTASGGTHDRGGVVDLAPYDHERKVRAARALGAFAWFRPAIPGLWDDHIHLGIRNHGRLSRAAKVQQLAYDATPPRDGLASNLPDPTWHPSPRVLFHYRKGVKK